MRLFDIFNFLVSSNKAMSRSCFVRCSAIAATFLCVAVVLTVLIDRVTELHVLTEAVYAAEQRAVQSLKFVVVVSSFKTTS